MNVATKKKSSLNDVELKKYLISFIDRAKNRAQLLLLLEATHDIFAEDVEEDAATFWSRYTPEQRAELEKSFEETYDPSRWVSHEEVMKKYEKV